MSATSKRSYPSIRYHKELYSRKLSKRIQKIRLVLLLCNKSLVSFIIAQQIFLQEHLLNLK